ncbi:MAG: hypothetical protein KF773_28765 [Deltaproteobacteria bacterium]|nr:hypothetical protein [Deltaproteobacteria bacterium]
MTPPGDDGSSGDAPHAHDAPGPHAAAPAHDDGRDDDGPDDDGPSAEGAEGTDPTGRRRRRRRRRRGERRDDPASPASPTSPTGAAGTPADAPRPERPERPERSERSDGPRRERRQWGDRAHARPTAEAPAVEAPAVDAPAAGAGADADPGDGTGGERRESRRERARRRREPRPARDGAAAPTDTSPPTASPTSSPPTPPAGEPRRDGRPDGRADVRSDARSDGRPDGRGGRDARDARGGRGERRDGNREPRTERRDARDPNRREREDRAAQDRVADQVRMLEPASPRLEARARPAAHPTDDDDPVAETPSEAWGTDEPGPPPDVRLAADLPDDAPPDDDDPSTLPIAEAPSATLGDDVVSAVGVRFVANGRITWFDAGDADYRSGERILVDGERGTRLATVAIPPSRKSLAGRERPRRVVRRANEHDLRGERDGDADRGKALRIAKDVAAALRMPLKVFRVELAGPPGRAAKANVYYTSDERLDMRDLIRDLQRELARGLGGSPRIELRQLGVRDEAKAVGGIGSCGLTLCCTTWLPDFVPVSIKMAKDQGLVLSPTKVSGQCGRLKCCLVYEQAGYAELRKGLPKLGKRVIGARGEGRVVEVDVLRQRVRISYGPGDTEVVPAAEVRPMFPSGMPPGQRPTGPQPAATSFDDAADDDAVPETDDPNAVSLLRATAPVSAEHAVPPPDATDDPDDPDDPDDDLADVADLPDEDPSRDPNADD